ncbi:MAG: NUDIX domain-containing protein [Opitutaceae bacterium]|nr:NUDIX domain-containing protein [Opitutaceae bacterium]
MSPEEWFDVVDEEDRVVGAAPRREVHARGLLHRAVHALVFDSAGRVLLQKRSAAKDMYPNQWAASASGHVDRGEDYDTAIVREMGEELGIVVTEVPARLCRILACEDTGREFVWVYSCRHDGPVRPKEDEISEVVWRLPQEVDRWVGERPEEFAPSFLLVWARWRATAGQGRDGAATKR